MLTAAQVASLLSISQRAVYDIPLNELPRYHLGRGRGAVRYEPADVEAYKQACRSAGTPATSDGALSSTALSTADDSALLGYFRRAGLKPKQTPSTSRKSPGSTPLQLVSSSATP